MERIGGFRGDPCFTCSKNEFIENKLYFVSNNVYIIGETMVQNNKVIGYYDGNSVADAERPYKIYCNIEKVSKTVKENNFSEVDYQSLINQIDFKDYTKEVDNFFKNNV